MRPTVIALCGQANYIRSHNVEKRKRERKKKKIQTTTKMTGLGKGLAKHVDLPESVPQGPKRELGSTCRKIESAITGGGSLHLDETRKEEEKGLSQKSKKRSKSKQQERKNAEDDKNKTQSQSSCRLSCFYLIRDHQST